MPVVTGLEGSVKSAVLRRDGIGEVARMLDEGEVDLGLVPMLDCLKNPALGVLPAASCSVLGPSRLFMLYSNKLPTEIRRVLVDREDYGTTALAQLMMRRKLMISPEFIRSNT